MIFLTCQLFVPFFVKFWLNFASLSKTALLLWFTFTLVLVLQGKNNKVKQRWEIFHSCYEPFLSDSDIERILKIDQHLPKLQ